VRPSVPALLLVPQVQWGLMVPWLLLDLSVPENPWVRSRQLRQLGQALPLLPWVRARQWHLQGQWGQLDLLGQRVRSGRQGPTGPEVR
jgi:hypothetical protein